MSILRTQHAILLMLVFTSQIGAYNTQPLGLNEHALGLSHIQHTPFTWNGVDGSYSSNRQLTSFNYQFDSSMESKIKLRIYGSQYDYSLADSSDLSLKLNDLNTSGIEISAKQQYKNHGFDLGYDMSDSFKTNHMYFNYACQFENISLLADYQYSKQSWSFNINDAISSIPGKIEYYESNISLGAIGHTKWGDLRVSAKASSKLNAQGIPDKNIHLLLQPYQQGVDLQYSYDLESGSRLKMFYQFSTDTLNTEFTKQTNTIGKLYAFDHSISKIGFVWENTPLTHRLTHTTFTGRISGYLLASYFANILSPLSGARYYQQLEANASILEYTLDYQWQINDRLHAALTQILTAGTADLYSKHYVFLLFSPITDLQIQKIDIHSFLMDKLSLQLEAEIAQDLWMNFGARYTIPLYIDVEIHPEAEMGESDFKLDYQYHMALEYIFQR